MQPDLTAHRIASAVVDRLVRGGRNLGRDSLYNLIREVAIDVLDQEESNVAVPR